MLANPALIREVVRWLARGLSVLSTIVLLLFLFGEPFPVARVTAVQWLGLLFFPLGIIIGFVIAWWKESVGGALTIASLVAFYVVFGFLLNGNLKQGWAFLVFASPGLLFLLFWLLDRTVGSISVKATS